MRPARVVALSGGIGGAKLALGLARVLPEPEALLVVANPGDDFEHLGLAICPDLDTLVYTLAGLADPVRAWGRRDETWTFMAALEALGGETWFRLGDGDLALHVERTRRLRAGEGLSDVTADIRRRLGIRARVLPASDRPVRTTVETAAGPLSFQRYFVRDRCRPAVRGFRFEGAAAARPVPAILEALADPALAAVVLCPSNPFISIDPILAVSGLRPALETAAAPVVAVSPVVGGRTVKGPLAKMLAELGLPVSPASVWRHYGSLLDGMVLDAADAGLASAAEADGLPVRVTQTVMRSLEDRDRLAESVLDFAASLR